MINNFPISTFHFPVNFRVINLKIGKFVTHRKLATGDWKFFQGFTLIELLVVISIIGILIALSIFGLEGARAASRDGKRKADMELIRSGLEIYKSDCNGYPVAPTAGSPSVALNVNGSGELLGSGLSSSCKSENSYISQIPADPIYPADDYLYWSDGTTYQICASLEQNKSAPAVTCGSSSACGSAVCNYQVTNP